MSNAKKDKLEKELHQLLTEAAKLHKNSAGIVSDPDWAMWYANFLLDELNRQLNTNLSRSELVYCLIKIRHEFEILNSDQGWESHLTNYLISRFAPHDESIQPNLSLYTSPLCPFCLYVMGAITMLRLDVELRNITTNQAHYDDLLAERKRGTVPVLRIQCPNEEVWMPESKDIVQYLRTIKSK